MCMGGSLYWSQVREHRLGKCAKMRLGNRNIWPENCCHPWTLFHCPYKQFHFPFIFHQNFSIHTFIFENPNWLSFTIIGFWFRNLGYCLSQCRTGPIEEGAGWSWTAKMTSSHYFSPFWLFKIQKLSSAYFLYS